LPKKFKKCAVILANPKMITFISMRRRPLYFLPLGIAIGAGIGVVFNNVAIGVAIGAALGVALSGISRRR
jgi:hypothetical protein